MFFADFPYVSDFFKATLHDHRIPVADTPAARSLGLADTCAWQSTDAILDAARDGNLTPLYATSENAIGWLAQHPVFAPTNTLIAQFKDKAAFRRNTQHLFPDFQFRAVAAADLAAVDPTTLPMPCIVKPSVGFFSMGVRRVESIADWPTTLHAIAADLERTQGLYPAEVMNPGTFLIEACIPGDEFAVDAYFDADGQPVVVGIFQHLFSGADDVSDRVYITSRAIVRDNLDAFTGFLAAIGAATGVRSFPVHVELRRDENGVLLPIEVNPMRFGGWCTTADVTAMAYAFNPYLCYLHADRPNWPAILTQPDDAVYSIVVLDNATGHTADAIAAFDAEAVMATFENPLQWRPIDYHQYPVFGFLFVKTRPDNMGELHRILCDDLRGFIRLRDDMSAAN